MVSYSKFIAIFASLLFLASGFAYVATDTGGGSLKEGSSYSVPSSSSNCSFPVDSFDGGLAESLGSSITTSFSQKGIVVSSGYFENTPNSGIVGNLTARLKNISYEGAFTLIVYHAFAYRKDILNDWLFAISNSTRNKSNAPLPVMPVSANSTKNQSHPSSAFYYSSTVAFSFSPESIFFSNCGSSINLLGFESFLGKNLRKPVSDVSFRTDFYSSQGYTPDSTVGMKYIGEYGWFSSYTSKGFNEVLYKYYEAQACHNGQEYYWFASNVSHAVKGYTNFWGGCKAWKYNDITNWQTSVYAGQVLCNYSPVNSGCHNFKSGNNPLFKIGASASIFGATIGISWPIYYGDYPNLNWVDDSNPATGCVNTFYRWGICADVGGTYTVYSISLGELNPTKAGGVLPMDIIQNDPAQLQSYWDDASCNLPSNTSYVDLCSHSV